LSKSNAALIENFFEWLESSYQRLAAFGHWRQIVAEFSFGFLAALGISIRAMTASARRAELSL
jgi:hypothetical protein